MLADLWFITPAFRRPELTELCLRQRRRLCDELGAYGYEATCVVVADDENLDVARGLGFETVEHDNRHLGAKFSAGYRAALAGGATHMLPIGSDSWMHHELLLEMPFADDEVAVTRRLSTIRPDGRERLDLTIKYEAGFGAATLYPRAAIEHAAGYPCNPTLMRGCDTSTWNRTARELGMGSEPVFFHQYEYTDFKSYDVQTTDYRRLKAVHEHVATQGDEAIDGLRVLYDGDLVDDLRAIYAGRPAWT